MRKYFYTDGRNKFGPFTLEELASENIDRETKVWFQELGEWTPAGNIPELREIFKLVPPPINPTRSNSHNMENTNQSPPKTWLVESILVTLFCCLPFGIAGIINASKVESRFNSGDVAGSERASAEAKKWTTLGFWLGMVGVILYFVMIFAGIAGGAAGL